MIAICPNPYRDSELAFTRRAMEMLQQEGFSCSVCPVFAEVEDEVLPRDISYKALQELGSDCTLLIVIGGDGTILAAVRALHEKEIPVLGVNLGTKGFMTSIEADEFDNDAVIHGYGECINITAYCDNDRMIGYSGDGVIVSTPTGSTGYSMSAGGPIVEPEAAAFIVTPICAHAIGAKPFVIGASKTIRVTTEKLHTRRAYLSVDGNSVLDLSSGDNMLIRRSAHRTLMARVGDKTFFEIAYEKL